MEDRTPTLLTPRLRLEPLHPSLAEALAAAVDDPDIARFTRQLSYPMSTNSSLAFIEASLAHRHGGRHASFVLRPAGGGPIIGGMGCTLSPDDDKPGEIGYWLSLEVRGKGYVQEALTALLAYVFDALDLPSVQAGADPDNQASRHILAKAGFVPCGSYTQPAPNKGGAPMTCHAYQLTQPLYRANKQAAGCFGAAGASQSAPLVLVAAAVLLDKDGRILLAQRPEGKSLAGLWEFPGGKVEPGESPELALTRELKEELGIDVSTSCLAPMTFASHAYADFHLLMPLFAIRVWGGTPSPREGQQLAWVAPNRLRDYPMPPADLPLVPLLFDLLT